MGNLWAHAHKCIVDSSLSPSYCYEDADDLEDSAEDGQSEREDEEEVVFPGHIQREIIDFTQGGEPVVIMVNVAVTPPAEPEFIPITLESPEYLEYIQNEHVIIRNSCA